MAASLEQAALSLKPGGLRAAIGGLWPLALGAVLAWAIWYFGPAAKGPYGYYNKILSDIGIAVVLAVSLNVVNGFTGQFSIGHAGFMAVGGYTAAAITYYGSYRLWGTAAIHGGFLGAGDWLFAGACVCGGLVSAACGWIVGMPSLRLKGDYLAIVTLGFGEILRNLLQLTDDVIYDPHEVQSTSFPLLFTKLGGALGFTGIPTYTTLFWVWLWVAIMAVVAYRLKASSYGRAFLSIREDEVAAAAMGVNVTRFKVWAFVISSFFAGVAGALFAHQLGNGLSAKELSFQKSFDVLIMVVLGGMGSISGAALAASIVTVLPEWLRDPGKIVPYWPYVAGLAALAAIVWGIRRAQGSRSPLMLRVAALSAAVLAIMGVAWFSDANGVNLGEYRLIIFALALILMMILRPSGLFGVWEVWDLLGRSGRDGGRTRGAGPASTTPGGGS